MSGTKCKNAKTRTQADSWRSRMLTVRKLIDYLKTQNPNACVLGYEVNSGAWIEQSGSLPNKLICTVAEDKVNLQAYLEKAYCGVKDANKKVSKIMRDTYRYSNDDDVVIRF